MCVFMTMVSKHTHLFVWMNFYIYIFFFRSVLLNLQHNVKSGFVIKKSERLKLLTRSVAFFCFFKKKSNSFIQVLNEKVKKKNKND